jgi:hypothetical protein
MDSKQQKALLQSVRASLLKVSPLKLMHVCVLFAATTQSVRAYPKQTVPACLGSSVVIVRQVQELEQTVGSFLGDQQLLDIQL